MSRRGLIIVVFFAALAGGLISVGFYTLVVQPEHPEPAYKSIAEHQKVALRTEEYRAPNVTVPDGLNFIESAAIATKTVVYIESRQTGLLSNYGPMPSIGSGSGVIISDDGYIVTNNHVIEDAEEILVTLHDNRRYTAKLIGTDPSTDLALLSIDEKELPFMKYGDSDGLLIGEWVLAVGNPFNLNSTVTAGIVSAKTRAIGVLENQNSLRIESFIQTDAAVNPGNSGGALVDLTGELIGINTAIATRTGSYSGYSFAIPVTLVKKVMDDLLEFGVVQRGLLGISIRDVSDVSKREDLDVLNGVYVVTVNSNTAAEEAGLEDGDIIVSIDDKDVLNVSELQELVARNRPGDDVKVTFIRDGKEHNVVATLRNYVGDTETIVKTEDAVLEGATFENITNRDANRYDINGGVKVTEIQSGRWKDTGMDEGFIITEIDKIRIGSVGDLKRVLSNKVGDRIIVKGVESEGERSSFSMDW